LTTHTALTLTLTLTADHTQDHRAPLRGPRWGQVSDYAGSTSKLKDQKCGVDLGGV